MFPKTEKQFKILGAVLGGLAGLISAMISTWNNAPDHFRRSPIIAATTGFTLAVSFLFPLEYFRDRRFPSTPGMSPFDSALLTTTWKGLKISLGLFFVVGARYVLLHTWLGIL